MKIIFKTIEIQNFLKVGNNPIIIQLDRSPSTLITGKNGVGKSSLITDSITFALFGKPYRKITKGELINTINQKGCLVKLEFLKENDVFHITRGIKPNIFEITKNGKELDDLSGIRDLQAWLEQSILKFDMNSFIRTCLLSTTNYKPFMTLSAGDRRAFVDKILSVEIFTMMNKIHKENLSILNDKITQKKNELSKLQTIREGKERAINLLKASSDDGKEELMKEILSYKSEYDKQKEIANSIQEEISNKTNEELYTKLKEYTNKISSSVFEQTSSYRSINEKKKRLSFFETTPKCSLCEQNIEEKHIHKQQTLLEEQIVFLEDHIIKQKMEEKENNDLLEQANQKISEIDKLKSKLSNVNNSLLTIRKILEEKSTKYKEKKEIESTVEIEKELEDLKLNQTTLSEELSSLQEEKSMLSSVSPALKDEGLRGQVIKRFLPVLNQKINSFLDQLNFPMRLILDEAFSENIIGRFPNEFSYEALSAGQRQRIELSLLFAWREVSAMKSGVDCNLLVFDEVLDSSLDANGVDDLFSILETIHKGTNIFIISHKQIATDKIRSSIELEVKNDFTRIVV